VKKSARRRKICWPLRDDKSDRSGWQQRRRAGPLIVHRSPRATSRQRPGSSHLAFATRAQELIRLDAEAFNALGSTANLLSDTLTDRSGRRGLVGAPAAGHCRARVDTHWALHLGRRGGPARRSCPLPGHGRVGAGSIPTAAGCRRIRGEGSASVPRSGSARPTWRHGR
jgi:hypothetical protein